jgi:8-oxo-dGTP pyrophosphatase MutT (NUDIX family)
MKPYDASIIEALRREVREETSLDIPGNQFKPVFTTSYDFGEGSVHFFVTVLSSDVRLRLDESELAEWSWFTLDEARRLPMFPATKAFIQYLLRETS